MRVLAKYNGVSPPVRPMDWKLVEAVAAYHDKRRRGSHKVWASM